MSDHVDGPRSIGEPAADVTDLFAFTSPENPARTVLAMCVFPSAGESAVFSNVIDYAIAVRRVNVAGVGNASRFEPADADALYGKGAVADGRPQKYFGSSNGWPMSCEPSTLPSFTIRLPLAWWGNSAWATPVIANG